jgi:hypothetical protein
MNNSPLNGLQLLLGFKQIPLRVIRVSLVQPKGKANHLYKLVLNKTIGSPIWLGVATVLSNIEHGQQRRDIRLRPLSVCPNEIGNLHSQRVKKLSRKAAFVEKLKGLLASLENRVKLRLNIASYSDLDVIVPEG